MVNILFRQESNEFPEVSFIIYFKMERPRNINQTLKQCSYIYYMSKEIYYIYTIVN